MQNRRIEAFGEPGEDRSEKLASLLPLTLVAPEPRCNSSRAVARTSNIQAIVRVRPAPLPPRVTVDDRNAHRAFVATLGNDAVWLDYFVVRSVA